MAGMVIGVGYMTGVILPYFIGKFCIFSLPIFFEFSDLDNFNRIASIVNAFVSLVIGASTCEILMIDTFQDKFKLSRLLKILIISIILSLLGYIIYTLDLYEYVKILCFVIFIGFYLWYEMRKRFK